MMRRAVDLLLMLIGLAVGVVAAAIGRGYLPGPADRAGDENATTTTAARWTLAATVAVSILLGLLAVTPASAAVMDRTADPWASPSAGVDAASHGYDSVATPAVDDAGALSGPESRVLATRAATGSRTFSGALSTIAYR